MRDFIISIFQITKLFHVSYMILQSFCFIMELKNNHETTWNKKLNKTNLLSIEHERMKETKCMHLNLELFKMLIIFVKYAFLYMYKYLNVLNKGFIFLEASSPNFTKQYCRADPVYDCKLDKCLFTSLGLPMEKISRDHRYCKFAWLNLALLI